MNEKELTEIWSKIRCAALLIGLNLVWIIPLCAQFYNLYVGGGM